MEQFAAIRWDFHREGLSVRALAEKYGVHRRTVRQALKSAVPPARKPPVRSTPVRDAVLEQVDAMLRADLLAPPKQRHTARRIYERLVDEHDAQVSYSYVAKIVHKRRPQIIAEARDRAGVLGGFVPQTHQPGQDAEVDFGEVWVNLAGTPTKCFLFTLRMSFSGRACHTVFASQGQEAFFEGHVAALTALGGAPAGLIRYDNLKPAVHRVCFGRNRKESERWIAFRSHFSITPFYCIPGQEGAHEKGGVEGEVGRFRRRWFVPVPEVDSLEELNARLAEADAAENARRIDQRTTTIGTDFALEAPLLTPLPEEGFDCALTLTPKVDRYSRIPVRQCRYSVPARLIDRRVRVRLSASHLEVYDGSQRVAVHPRLTARGASNLVLDHYLEILRGKPGAFPGSTPLAQARAAGAFTPAHDAFWSAARGKHGDTDGTRLLIEVLLLHRRMPTTHVIAGIKAAVQAGSVSPDVVAIEARKHAAATKPAAGGWTGDPTGSEEHPTIAADDRKQGQERDLSPRRSRAAVVTLQARRMANLPPDQRPAPSVADYDQLLSQRTDSGRVS